MGPRFSAVVLGLVVLVAPVFLKAEGLKIGLEESRRVVVEKGTEVFYRLMVHGVNPKKEYGLFMFVQGVTEKPQLVEVFSPSPKGLLGKNKGKLIDEYELNANKFQRGLGLEAILSSEDGTEIAKDQVFPFPISATDGSCRVWLQLVTADGNTFLVSGSGFDQSSHPTFVSISGNERIDNDLPGFKDGSFGGMMLLPGVIGKTSGKSSFQVNDKRCHPKVDYIWGKEALKPQ